MNKPFDPKSLEPFRVTTGPLPASQKLYSPAPGFPDVLVPYREISVHPSAKEPPIRVYDTTLDDDGHWRRWSAGILAQVRHYSKQTREPSILVLAGARYVDGWAPEARALGVTVDEPLRGLELGARRAFARELLLGTPARGLSDTLDTSPRDQLLSFAAAFHHRLRAPEAAW